MNNVLSIARREFATYFNSAMAYTVLGFYLTVAGAIFFFTLLGPGLFVAGNASMRAFFEFSPWLLMIVVPAVTMRLIAEERKSGTLEVLMTLPVRELDIVLGKYIGAMAMMGVGLLFTLPIPVVLSGLVAEGFSFDWGTTFTGYVGMFFLVSAFVAVGMWISSMAKNQISAFIIAFMVCAVLNLLRFVTVFLPESIGPIFQNLSTFTHFENVSRGVLDSRDVIYYVAITFMGLAFSVWGLRSEVRLGLRRSLIGRLSITGERAAGEGMSARRRASLAITTLSLLGSLVCLNLLSVNHFVRVDFTADNVYTLSDASRTTMTDLEDPVTVTAYFSGDLPTQFEPIRRYVKDLLEEYRAASKGNLSFEFIDPTTQETDEDKELKKEVKQDIFGRRVRERTSVETELQGLGIQPVEMRVIEDDNATTKRGYMGIVVRYQEETEVIPVVQDIGSIEYDLTTMIRRLTRTRVPVLGLLQGKGEPTLDEGLARLKPLLEQNYELKAIDLSKTGESDIKLDDQIDALLVIGNSSAYSESEKKRIDEWLMTGRSAAFMVNLVDVDLKTFQPVEVDHGWDDLLSAYGIEIGDKLVADVECASLSIQEKRGFMIVQMPKKYPFIPQLKLLEGESPVTRGITDMPLPFVSPLFLKTDLPNVTVQSLAKSSEKSWLEDADPAKMDPRRDWSQEDIAITGPYDLMAAAEGKLPSRYTEGQTAEKDARVMVLGTGGITQEEFLGPQSATLLLNMVDWMLLDRALLEMRSRGMSVAPIDPELTDSTRVAVKWALTLGVPFLLALYGFVRRAMRSARRKALAA